MCVHISPLNILKNNITPRKSVTKPGIINKTAATFLHIQSFGSFPNFSYFLKTTIFLRSIIPRPMVIIIKNITEKKPKISPNNIKLIISKIGNSKIIFKLMLNYTI